MDSWNSLTAVAQQFAGDHPIVFWGGLGLLSVSVIDFFGDKHAMVGARFIGAIFLLLSMFWFFSTNDIHQMLLAVASCIVEASILLSVEIENNIIESMRISTKELGVRLDAAHDRLESTIERKFSAFEERLDSLRDELERINDPTLSRLEDNLSNAESSIPYLGSQGIELVDEAERALEEHLEKKRR